MKQKKQRVCMAGSLYTLTFYLITSSLDDIKSTVYYTDDFLPEAVRKNLNNQRFFSRAQLRNMNKYYAALYGWYIRHIKYRELLCADIFGLDFYWWLLRGLKTNYIEDGPYVFDIWEGTQLHHSHLDYLRDSWIKRKLKALLFGNYYQCPVGTSVDTVSVSSSVPYDKEYHRGKKKYVYNLKEEWDNSTEEKKKEILRIMNITDEVLEMLTKKNTVLLTQPYYVDGYMSQEEQIETYRNIINHYGEDNVLIKPHPRDLLPYSTLFPKALTFNVPIAMQFLVILGADFEKIATINSSSALSFGVDKDIDWWAEKMPVEKVKNEGLPTLKEAKAYMLKSN